MAERQINMFWWLTAKLQSGAEQVLWQYGEWKSQKVPAECRQVWLIASIRAPCRAKNGADEGTLHEVSVLFLLCIEACIHL